MKKSRLTIRRLGIIALSLLVLLIFVSFVPLSSESVKEKIIHFVAEETGYQVEVTGTFDFYLSLTPGFEASGIRIFENPQSAVYEIKRLALNVSLFSLMTDELVVNSIEIEGMDIGFISRTETGPVAFAELELPAIHALRLKDITVNHGESELLFIDDWKFRKELIGHNLRLEGKGKLHGKAYKISSQLGTLDQFLASESSFPVDITFQYYKTVLSLNGSIIDPLGKSELQIDVGAKVPNVSSALAAAGIDIPEVGQASASAKLGGDLAVPSLQNIEVKITRGKSISAEATASIDNLYALENQAIKVKGFIDKDKSFFNWLTPEVTVGEGRWQFSGIIVNKKAGLQLTDVQIEGEEPAGYSMTIRGEGMLDNFNARQPFSQLALEVDINARQNIARAFFNDAIPGMGDLRGRLRINAKSESALSVDGIDLSTMLSGEMPLTARGKIDHIPLQESELLSGIGIDLSLNATDSVKLGQLLETELPDISPVTASWNLAGTEQQYLVENFSLQAGTAEKLLLQAKGDVDLHETGYKDLIKDMKLKVDITSVDTQSVENALDFTLAELGPVKGSFHLHGDARQVRLTNINLNAGVADGLQLAAKGEVKRIELEPEFRVADVQLSMTAKAATTSSLSPLLDFDVPDYGLLQGKGKIITRNNRIGLHDAEITADLPNNRMIKARGKIIDLVELKGVSWNVDVDLDSDESFKKVIGHPVADLGAVHGDLLVSDEDGSLGLEEIVVTSKQEGLLKIRLNGLLDDIKNREKMDVSADITTSNLKIVGSLLGQDWPDTRPAKLNGWFRVNDNRTNFDGSLLVGETMVTAEISALAVEPRVKINGEISTRLLHLEDFGLIVSGPGAGVTDPKPKSTTDKKSTVASAGTGEKIFSAESFSLDWMKQADLDLKILVADVADAEAKLESFNIPLQIRDGEVLQISPARVDYEGGAIELDFRIDATSTETETALKVKADDLPLGQLRSSMGVQEKIEGSLDFHMDLDTRGNSPAAMASNLNGVIELGMEDVEASKDKFDLLTKDLFGWVVSSTLLRSKQERLDCGIVVFEANKGKLVSKLIFFDGTNLKLSGEGTIDLGQETVDFYFIPKQKRSLLSNATPVHLTGPLSDPKPAAISSAEIGVLAAKGYAGLAILPTVTIPAAVIGSLGGLFTQDESKGDKSACLKYLEQQ